MRHIPDGTLRRLYDEPLALSSQERGHYAACSQCQSRFTAIAGDAREAVRLFAGPSPRVDPSLALARHRLLMATQGSSSTRRWYQFLYHHNYYERTTMIIRHYRAQLVKPLGGLAAVAILVGALAFTPAGSLAQSFITIFQPQQFAAVSVTTDDLQGLPHLDNYGTMSTVTNPSTQNVATLQEAAAASGLTLRTPAQLPATVPATVSYSVMSGGEQAFTFSAAKAAAAAAASGKALPAMPAGIDGSTLRVTVGPGVMATYGAPLPVIKSGKAGSSFFGNLPVLGIWQMPAPRVSSTGASAAAIEEYLLDQPGISPQLVNAIKAIGDPTSTMPVPIPINLASGHPVTVQGVQGLAIGDNTGLGSGVLWQKDGMVYAVAGTLSENDVLAIAESLH